MFGKQAHTHDTVPFQLVANKRRSPNAGTLLGHRLQRWHNIVPALGECVVFAGSPPSHIPADARGTFDNHGQINDAVSLQPIHTPDLYIYINNDLM